MISSIYPINRKYPITFRFITHVLRGKNYIQGIFENTWGRGRGPKTTSPHNTKQSQSALGKNQIYPEYTSNHCNHYINMCLFMRVLLGENIGYSTNMSGERDV
ncbi:hypothetical protein [Aminobacter phage Erebus]|nr:hypothetical protein [Aminobacter phage Erebus]